MKSGLRRAARPRNASGGPPVRMGAASSFSGSGPGGGNPDLALLRAYKSNGTARANIGLIASSVAKPQWGLYRQVPASQSQRFTTSDQGSDQRPQVQVHAALNVLSTPASILVPSGRRKVIWDRFRLMELSQIWMESCGKSHWVVDFAEGASPFPLGMWPVRPDRMIPVPDKDRYLAGWAYRPPDGSQMVPLYPDEVIFNNYADPEDPYGGCGPIQSVLNDIEAADYAAQWNRNYFINSADPGGILQVDHEFEEGEFDEIVNQWRETHRGVARAHRIGVLEAGVTYIPNTHANSKDMDFVNMRTISRDIIREALAIAKVMTGVSDDVNRANAQTGQEVFAEWNIAPRLDRWKDVLNTQFLPLFGDTANGLEFDYTYPTPANREQDALELTSKTTALVACISAGMEPHAALKLVGLPDAEFLEQATQQPALPPGWVAPAPAGGDPVAVAEAILRAASARDPRALAVYNQLQLTGGR